MIGTTDDNARGGLLLEVAAEAKVGIACDEHLFVHRAVGIMAGGAALADGLMLEDKWAALDGVAFATGIVLREQRSSTAADSRAFVGIVAITATDFAIQHRMAVGELELAFFIEMTLKAGVRCLFGIDDAVVRATGLIVDTAGAVAGFAADVFGVRSLGLEPGVGGGFEIARDLGMTFGASSGANKFGAGNLRRSDDGARHRGTGDEANRHERQGQE